MDSKLRRSLSAAGNTLKAAIAIAGGDLSESVIKHVQTAFGDEQLMKVRVHGDDRVECQLVGEQLAEKVPCEVVSVRGRVLLLYRAKE
jgi:RNA-binding protein YhbY